jgi:uncharacterized protein YlxW (UPF0749 family)
VASFTLRKRKSARYHRSRPVDCLRRGSHACDRTTFTLWQWRSVVYGGTGVVLFTLIVGFLEWKAQRRERARDKADKAELIRLLQESQEQNRAEFQTLKADIKAINQKPEAAQQKARLVSSSIPRSARQSVRLRQRVRDRASRIRVERGRSVCLARGNLGR